MKTRFMLTMMTMAGLCASSGCGPKRGGEDGGGRAMEAQVIILQVTKQPVTETLSLVGSIAANEFVELKPETEGIVQAIVFEEGQEVAKGALLVGLDESKFAAALAEAEANYKLAQANFARGQQLFRDKLVSQQEFEQAAATFEVTRAGVELMKRHLKDARIYAPFSGIVGARRVSPGQVVTRSTVLTTLVDLDPVKVEINVPERFLGQIQTGQELELAVAAHPGRKFAGKVYFVAAQIDEITRTALVKALIANPQRELKPGMFASLDLTLQVRDRAILIPESCLMFSGDEARVFVVGTNQTAQMRPVRLGLRLPGMVEVTAGLAEQELVVREGLQKVVPGMRVRQAEPAGTSPPAQRTNSVPAGA